MQTQCPFCGKPVRSPSSRWTHAWNHVLQLRSRGFVEFERLDGSYIVKLDGRALKFSSKPDFLVQLYQLLPPEARAAAAENGGKKSEKRGNHPKRPPPSRRRFVELEKQLRKRRRKAVLAELFEKRNGKLRCKLCGKWCKSEKIAVQHASNRHKTAVYRISLTVLTRAGEELNAPEWLVQNILDAVKPL